MLAAIVPLALTGCTNTESPQRPRLLGANAARMGDLNWVAAAYAPEQHETELMQVHRIVCVPTPKASGRPRLIIEPACDVLSKIDLKRVD
jgi:hypothetical protein